MMLTDKLHNEKVLRDPIHKFIHIQDRVILDLINTTEFQRLRRIQQLGITSAVFHVLAILLVPMKLPVELPSILSNIMRPLHQKMASGIPTNGS